MSYTQVSYVGKNCVQYLYTQPALCIDARVTHSSSPRRQFVVMHTHHRLIQAPLQHYPDTHLLLYTIVGTLAGFVASMTCKVVSLTIIATPSVICSVTMILFLKAIIPVHPRSIVKQSLLCTVVMPVSRINLVISLFPVISIAFAIAYRTVMQPTDLADIPVFDYVTRYSTINHIIIMYFALMAAALAALSCILCQSARPIFEEALCDEPIVDERIFDDPIVDEE